MRFERSLAWLQIVHQKNRLIVALTGIAFAVFLIFMQLGLQSSLYESATAFHQSLQADLVLIHHRSLALYSLLRFSRRHLYQALSVNEVESVNAVYVAPQILAHFVETSPSLTLSP